MPEPNLESIPPSSDPAKKLAAGLLELEKNKTNSELAQDENFIEWCQKRNIKPSKRQVAKHRDKYLEWLEQEFDKEGE